MDEAQGRCLSIRQIFTSKSLPGILQLLRHHQGPFSWFLDIPLYLSIFLSFFLSFFLKLCVVMAAYAWVKCEREADADCYSVFKDGMIISREGTLFGADNRHARLSLIKSQDDFDQLLMRMRELSSPLKPSK